jgi:hypothetical protein
MSQHDMQTSADQFGILRVSGQWRLYRNGQDAGRFDYQVDAVDCAQRLASTARVHGSSTEILVQDPCGRLETICLDGRPDTIGSHGSGQGGSR